MFISFRDINENLSVLYIKYLCRNGQNFNELKLRIKLLY